MDSAAVSMLVDSRDEEAVADLGEGSLSASSKAPSVTGLMSRDAAAVVKFAESPGVEVASLAGESPGVEVASLTGVLSSGV